MNNRDSLTAKFYKACIKESIPTFLSKPARQADECSCRTDALVVLRNALLNLQQSPVKSVRERLLNIQPYTDDRGHTCELPLEWDYTSQISNKQPGAEATYIPRDLFSKSQKTKDHPRTVKQFREQQKEHTSSVAILKCGFTKDKEDLPEVHEPYRIEKNSRSEQKFLIKKTQEELHNTYLVRKGFKLTKKYHSNHLE